MASRLNHLLDNYRALQGRGEPLVMATIVETLGSTYQKAGARLLITADGDSRGLLSGGCFENDLREQAELIFADGRARQRFYDLRALDDTVWGLGLGCNGAVRVLLQLLSPDTDYYPLNRIAETVNNKQTGILATLCESTLEGLPEGCSFFLDPQKVEPHTTSAAINTQLSLQSRQTWLERRPRLRELIAGDQVLKVFYDMIEPLPELLVIGAGDDAVPLTRLAATLGWRVTVIDHRPAYLNPDRFPDAAGLLHCHPEEFYAAVNPDRFSALVLMTHNFDYDARYLKTIADSTVPYVGLLGPAQRRERLFAELGALSVKISGRTFGPVGLDIGAETPEEIALSIVAEIQAVMKQRDGASLSSKNAPAQSRAPATSVRRL